MKVSFFKTVACLTLFSIAPTAMADGPGWTPDSFVTKLVVTSAGGVNIKLSPDLGDCVAQSGYGPSFASVLPAHPGINLIKSDLLAAYMSGTKVSLYLSDDQCTVTEIILGGWH